MSGEPGQGTARLASLPPRTTKTRPCSAKITPHPLQGWKTLSRRFCTHSRWPQDSPARQAEMPVTCTHDDVPRRLFLTKSPFIPQKDNPKSSAPIRARSPPTPEPERAMDAPVIINPRQTYRRGCRLVPGERLSTRSPHHPHSPPPTLTISKAANAISSIARKTLPAAVRGEMLIPPSAAGPDPANARRSLIFCSVPGTVPLAPPPPPPFFVPPPALLSLRQTAADAMVVTGYKKPPGPAAEWQTLSGSVRGEGGDGGCTAAVASHPSHR